MYSLTEINIFFSSYFALKELFSVMWQFPELSSLPKKYSGIVMNVLISRLKKHIKSRFEWGKEASAEEV